MPQKRNRRGQGALDLTTPLTQRQAKRRVKTVARLATRPQYRALKEEKRGEKVQRQHTRDYFEGYYPAVDEAAQKASTATQTALNQINSAASSSSAYAEQLRQRLAAEGQADAAQRGGTYDASADQEAIKAQLARLGSANTIGAVTAAQGASTQGYLADKGRIARREMVDQLQRSHDRSRSIDRERRNVALQERDLRRDEFGRLVDAERDYALGRSAARLDKRGQKIDARLTAAQQAETRRHNLTSEQISQQNANTSRGNLRQRRREQRGSQREDRQGRRAAIREAMAEIEGTIPVRYDPKKSPDIAAFDVNKDNTLSSAEQLAYLKANRRGAINLGVDEASPAQARAAYRKVLQRLKRQRVQQVANVGF